MVGFIIGLIVGASLGFMVMSVIKIGDTEDYYIDLIKTYDKEVNRQYKILLNVADYVEKNISGKDYEKIKEIMLEEKECKK